MRSYVPGYELLAPRDLAHALELVAGGWRLIAGGTDVMVLFEAGKLAHRRWISIRGLAELRGIDVAPEHVTIGALTTYTDVRRSAILAAEFPMLGEAAALTGGIATQNRGTLGGNIVNASPAADSLPALLVYEAELILVSVRGERRIPYVDFHTGYKQTVLAPGELIRAVCLARRFTACVSYSRKVGARNAQAISKVCVAALGRVVSGTVEDVRIAAGSVAPTPVRLRETERAVRGKRIDDALVSQARKTAVSEIRPIDDIRSTAAYRAAVTGNLVAEFLQQLQARGESG